MFGDLVKPITDKWRHKKITDHLVALRKLQVADNKKKKIKKKLDKELKSQVKEKMRIKALEDREIKNKAIEKSMLVDPTAPARFEDPVDVGVVPQTATQATVPKPKKKKQ